MGKKEIKGEQSTVRMSTGLKEKMEEYLKSKDARTNGWDSDRDIVDYAVRTFLVERRFL